MKRQFTKYPQSYVKASKYVAEYYFRGPASNEDSEKVVIEADDPDEAMRIARNRKEAKYYNHIFISDYNPSSELTLGELAKILYKKQANDLPKRHSIEEFMTYLDSIGVSATYDEVSDAVDLLNYWHN